MIACAWDWLSVTGNHPEQPSACPNPVTWRRHHGDDNCWEHNHTLYCDQHAPLVAPRDQFTPATDIEGIYQHDGTHPRHRRVAPRGE